MDLFENLNFVPATVSKVVLGLGENPNYKELQKAKEQLNKYGYTFDYGLDAVPYDLRKIKQR